MKFSVDQLTIHNLEKKTETQNKFEKYWKINEYEIQKSKIEKKIEKYYKFKFKKKKINWKTEILDLRLKIKWGSTKYSIQIFF